MYVYKYSFILSFHSAAFSVMVVAARSSAEFSACSSEPVESRSSVFGLFSKLDRSSATAGPSYRRLIPRGNARHDCRFSDWICGHLASTAFTDSRLTDEPHRFNTLHKPGDIYLQTITHICMPSNKQVSYLYRATFFIAHY